MGTCCSTEATATVTSAKGNAIPVKDNAHPVKDIAIPSENAQTLEKILQAEVEAVKKRSPFFPFSSPTPAHHLFAKNSPTPEGAPAATPKRFFKRTPSPARHIREALVRRQGKPKEAVADKEGAAGGGESGGGGRLRLDKGFGYKKGFGKEYEMGEEIGKGHFAYTCKAKFKKGDLKGQEVAVKVIPKAQVRFFRHCWVVNSISGVQKEVAFTGLRQAVVCGLMRKYTLIEMTTSIAIEDARKEVKILRALSGHNNTVKFYDAFEDHDNVYIVMELCEGGELLDRILSRGGKYTEDDAKVILIQILNFVSFCHLQGVVHRDLKPENFLFTSKEENSQLKAIDFGLSDFVMPDERINDIVGSAYYVAPEVLHRSYNTEADVWSIGVIAYILLCGIRPFWARTESGIFRAVLKANLCFDEPRWLSLSSEAKDFIKHLLKKDPRKRMTAAQALSHPWIKNNNEEKVPLDILILKLMKAYMHSSALRKAALQAVAKTLTADEQFYLKEQFTLLEPTESGTISLNNIKAALTIHATDAMKESRILEFLASLNGLQNRGMDFEEFCAATLSVHQLESRDRWEQHALHAYELFDKNGNRTIVVEELASELGVDPSVPVHAVLHDWIRHTDGKLSFLGFIKLLRGVSGRSLAKAR